MQTRVSTHDSKRRRRFHLEMLLRRHYLPIYSLLEPLFVIADHFMASIRVHTRVFDFPNGPKEKNDFNISPEPLFYLLGKWRLFSCDYFRSSVVSTWRKTRKSGRNLWPSYLPRNALPIPKISNFCRRIRRDLAKEFSIPLSRHSFVDRKSAALAYRLYLKL